MLKISIPSDYRHDASRNALCAAPAGKSKRRIHTGAACRAPRATSRGFKSREKVKITGSERCRCCTSTRPVGCTRLLADLRLSPPSVILPWSPVIRHFVTVFAKRHEAISPCVTEKYIIFGGGTFALFIGVNEQALSRGRGWTLSRWMCMHTRVCTPGASTIRANIRGNCSDQ